MRSLASLLLLTFPAMAAPPALYYAIAGQTPGSWPEILGAVALQPQPAGARADVIVVRAGSGQSAAPLMERVAGGAFLILEGRSAVAEAFGFRAGDERIRVRNVEDVHQPKLAVIWERALELPVFEVPAGAKVFARERWKA